MKCRSRWDPAYAELNANTHTHTERLILSQDSWEGIKGQFTLTCTCYAQEMQRGVLKVGSDRQARMWEGTISSTVSSVGFPVAQLLGDPFILLLSSLLLFLLSAASELVGSRHRHVLRVGCSRSKSCPRRRSDGFPTLTPPHAA